MFVKEEVGCFVSQKIIIWRILFSVTILSGFLMIPEDLIEKISVWF